MATIEHVFVLMLENRSFDHMLGFSGLTGTDAATGKSTQINGTSGAATNYSLSTSYHYDTEYFSYPAFTGSASGPMLTGGTD